MRPEKHNSRRAISPPKSTPQLPSATTHPNVDAIQRVDRGSELGWRAQLAVPLAALVALAIHLLFSKRAPAVETHSYTLFVYEIVGVSIVLAIAQRFWTPLCSCLRHMCPILTVAFLALCLWDLVTF